MHAANDTFTTDDGLPIQVRFWAPELGAPRGVVQILHGLAEHCARYGRLAEALTQEGWAVVSHDHRGHGGSVRDEGDRGHFADVDGWTLAVEDVGTVHDLAVARFPGVPVVLLGHSMGSTIATHVLATWPDRYAAAVLSGPVGVTGWLRKVGQLVVRLERVRLGRRGRSRLLHAMSFGDFNKAFEPARTEFDWLSRDPAEVDKYANDPLCGFVVTTQHWFDHLVALGELISPELLGKLRDDLPVYVFGGDQDPVGGAGKQVRPFVDLVRRAGVRDVHLKLYPGGRHEMLNDTVRDEVTSDLTTWLDRVLPA